MKRLSLEVEKIIKDIRNLKDIKDKTLIDIQNLFEPEKKKKIITN